MTVFNTDIEEYFDSFQISIYPIPAKEFLFIDIKGRLENGVLRIVDDSGNIVLSKEIIKNKEKIDLNMLSIGRYNLEINSADHRSINTFIKI